MSLLPRGFQPSLYLLISLFEVLKATIAPDGTTWYEIAHFAFYLVARNIYGASEMARKYRLHIFQFCSSVIATIFYCLAVAFFASPGLYFFIIIAQKFFIFSAMFYYSFAIVCLLLSKLFSKKTALIMTFGFMILCVAFFGATDSIEFYVISLLPLMTYMFFIYVYIDNRIC